MKNFLIGILAFISAVSADELSIARFPSTLSFQGETPLDAENVGDVFGATLGYSVAESNWDGLVIRDPFKSAAAVVSLVIEGLDRLQLPDAKSYAVVPPGTSNAIDAFLDSVVAHEGSVAEIDLKDQVRTPSETAFGQLQPIESELKAKALKPKTVKEDREFLEQVAYLRGVTEALASTDEHTPTALVVRLSLKPLQMVHESSSPAIGEALKVISAAVRDLGNAVEKAYGGRAVFAVASEQESLNRAKRATPRETTDDLVMAKTYSDDYPVFFNIIFWFSIVMLITLYAIALAIGGMDPGRDSIIYRMTSTRMKKDN